MIYEEEETLWFNIRFIYLLDVEKLFSGNTVNCLSELKKKMANNISTTVAYYLQGFVLLVLFHSFQYVIFKKAVK